MHDVLKFIEEPKAEPAYKAVKINALKAGDEFTTGVGGSGSKHTVVTMNPQPARAAGTIISYCSSNGEVYFSYPDTEVHTLVEDGLQTLEDRPAGTVFKSGGSVRTTTSMCFAGFVPSRNIHTGSLREISSNTLVRILGRFPEGRRAMKFIETPTPEEVLEDCTFGDLEVGGVCVNRVGRRFTRVALTPPLEGSDAIYMRGPGNAEYVKGCVPGGRTRRPAKHEPLTTTGDKLKRNEVFVLLRGDGVGQWLCLGEDTYGTVQAFRVDGSVPVVGLHSGDKVKVIGKLVAS